MGVIGSAVIEILPDSGGFAAKLNKDVSEAVEKTSEKTSGAFNKLAGIGQAALLGIGTAAVGVGTEAVHLADTFEESHARLVTAVTNSGRSYGDFSKQVSAADKSNEKFGLTADQTEGALARLTQGLNDPKKAADDLALAVNIAAARHIDLETAATLVGKVAAGNTTVLKRYGIDLDVAKGGAAALTKAHEALQKASENLQTVEEKVADGRLKGVAAADALKKAHESVALATDKVSSVSSSAGQAIAALSDRFGGSAAAQAETFHGKIVGLEAKAKDLGIQLGLVLIPIIEKVVSVVVDASDYFDKHRLILEIVAGIVGTVLVAAIGAYLASMIAATAATLAAAAPFLAIVAAVAALAAGVIYAYHHFEAFRDIVDTVKTFFVEAFQTIKVAWSDAGAVYEGNNWISKLGRGVQEVHRFALEFADFMDQHWQPILIGTAVAVGLLIAPLAVVAAGVIYAYEHFQTFRDVVDGVVGFVSEQITVFTKFWDDHWSEISSVVSQVANSIQFYFEFIKGTFRLAFEYLSPLIEIFWQGFQAAFHIAFDDVIAAIKINWDIIAGIFRVARDTLVGIVSVLLDLLSGHWGKAWDDIKNTVSNVFGDIYTTVRQVFTNIVALVKNLAVDFYNAAKGIGTAIVNGIVEILKDLGRDIGGSIAGALDHLPGGGVVKKILGFASGGLVPGPIGAPMLAVVHGGEFVLSRDMLAGAATGPSGGVSSFTVAPGAIVQNFAPGTDRSVVDYAREQVEQVLTEVLDRAAAGAGRRVSA